MKQQLELTSQNAKATGTGASWAKGAAILGIAAVISKLLGTLQKIPLQNVAGDSVYGIYTVVYPFYILILFLATAGFPIAISAFVSERLTNGDYAGARRVLHVSTVLLMLTGITGFALLYLGADQISDWIGNKETMPAIRSVSYALLFVPIMSALRGYYQGGGDMVPTAVSQVVEQFVRVGTMILILVLMTLHQMEASEIAAGATFGAVTGACAGMLVMLFYWRRDRRSSSVGAFKRSERITQRTARESYISLAVKLSRYALPICLGAIALPVMNIVDTFTLPRLFRDAGFSEEQAMALYGILARGQPLVQMVAMLFSAMAVALVPAIAEARVNKNERSVQLRSEMSIRMTWIIGSAAAAGLAALTVPINWMMYTDGQGSAAMMILAFSVVFSLLNIISASVLQGMGLVRIPAVNMLIAAAVKVGLNFMLTPWMGINGAALTAVVAFGIAAILNVFAIMKVTDTKLHLSAYVPKSLVALAIMTVAVLAWSQGLTMILEGFIPSLRGMYTIVALTGIIVGAFLYLAVIMKLKVITEKELLLFPGMEKKLLPLLRKFRLI